MFELNIDKKTWERFLDQITQPNTYDESCAWLFIDYPFSDEHTVYVYPVTNVGLRGCSTRDTFGPDKKELQQIKKKALSKKLTKIGNVHTHIVPPRFTLNCRFLDLDMALANFASPSPTDLKYARKFNDIIRGILTVRFKKDGEKGDIIATCWHNKFGVLQKLHLNLPDDMKGEKE